MLYHSRIITVYSWSIAVTQPIRLEFPIEKAIYLLTKETQPKQGGDKQKFWHEVMGFTSPEEVRAAILANLTVDSLELKKQDEYGERFQASSLVIGVSGVTWQIRTGWIVRYGEDIARFVTAIPERFGRRE
jgi:hypothetical protein